MPREPAANIACPVCGGPSRVADSRGTAAGIRRRRACTAAACDHRFSTTESIDHPGARTRRRIKQARAALDQATTHLEAALAGFGELGPEDDESYAPDGAGKGPGR